MLFYEAKRPARRQTRQARGTLREARTKSVMASSPRRDFLKLAFGGALAAASAALTSARASAEPLGPPSAFTPDSCWTWRATLAKSPFKPPKSTLPDVFSNLNFEQYSAIRRNPGSAVWSDEKFGFALEPLHRGFVFATPMQLYIVENGQAQRLIYDRAAYDFGKLQPPADLPDLGFSGVRVLKAAAGDGWQDLAIFQGATFFRSLARGQTYGVNARGLSIRTGDAQGEEFPLFRALWIEKPSPASDTLTIHALLDSASLTGAFHFTLRPGEATIIDTELTLVARVAVDHLGLGAMTATYLFGALDHRHPDDVRPNVYDVGGLQNLHRRRRMAVAAGRQSRHLADFRVRRHESARLRLSPARARPRRLRRRRRSLGIAPLAVDRADRRLGRGRSDCCSKSPPIPKTTTTSSRSGDRRRASPRARRSRSLIASSGAGRRRRVPTWRRSRVRAPARSASAGASSSNSSPICSPTRRKRPKRARRSRPRRGRSSPPAYIRTRSGARFASSSISIRDRSPIPNCASSSRRPINPSARHGSIDGQPDDARRRGAGDAARGAPGDASAIAAAIRPRRAARVGGAAARHDALADAAVHLRRRVRAHLLRRARNVRGRRSRRR